MWYIKAQNTIENIEQVPNESIKSTQQNIPSLTVNRSDVNKYIKEKLENIISKTISDIDEQKNVMLYIKELIYNYDRHIYQQITLLENKMTKDPHCYLCGLKINNKLDIKYIIPQSQKKYAALLNIIEILLNKIDQLKLTFITDFLNALKDFKKSSIPMSMALTQLKTQEPDIDISIIKKLKHFDPETSFWSMAFADKICNTMRNQMYPNIFFNWCALVVKSPTEQILKSVKDYLNETRKKFVIEKDRLPQLINIIEKTSYYTFREFANKSLIIMLNEINNISTLSKQNKDRILYFLLYLKKHPSFQYAQTTQEAKFNYDMHFIQMFQFLQTLQDDPQIKDIINNYSYLNNIYNIKLEDDKTKVESSKWEQTKIDMEIKYNMPELKCYICGLPITQSYSIDHVLPKSKYSKKAFDIENLFLAHLICNTSKSDIELYDLKVRANTILNYQNQIKGTEEDITYRLENIFGKDTLYTPLINKIKETLNKINIQIDEVEKIENVDLQQILYSQKD